MAQPLRFDAYVDRCLYDPDSGFYAAERGRAGGRRGDFVTSPEIGPLFGTVVMGAIEQWRERQGREAPISVFDAGSGPGALVKAMAAAPGVSLDDRRVTGFDRGADGPWPPPEVMAELAGAVVVANELLDNLAFRMVERMVDGWAEVHVAVGDDGAEVAAAERLLPVDDPLPPVVEALGDIAVGTRVPVLDQAREWVDRVVAAGASLIAFDYGAPTTAELVERGGWLRTYRQHERGDDPYREPGRWDITVDVPFDQLPPPDRLETQAAFLRRYGIDELVAEGKAYWRRHAAAPDLEAMRMRSRVSEAEALLDPSGLGGWLVAVWGEPEDDLQ